MPVAKPDICADMPGFVVSAEASVTSFGYRLRNTSPKTSLHGSSDLCLVVAHLENSSSDVELEHQGLLRHLTNEM